MMSDTSSGGNESQSPKQKGKPWYFIGIVGGILIGAQFDNVGAGVAIGIAFWLIMSFVEKKRKNSGGEIKQESDE